MSFLNQDRIKNVGSSVRNPILVGGGVYPDEDHGPAGNIPGQTNQVLTEDLSIFRSIVYLSIDLSFIDLSIYLSIYLSTYLYIYLSIHLSI